MSKVQHYLLSLDEVVFLPVLSAAYLVAVDNIVDDVLVQRKNLQKKIQ